MELRTLRFEEREALLDLLDGWDIGDGWRGRDFFRRYVENDPSFRDESVHVAVEGRELLSCVQVFPRTLRIRGHPVPLGGIGTVFTRETARRRGLGEALLARAVDAMREAGMLVSLLFAARVPWYTKLGWQSWQIERTRLRRDPAAAQPGLSPETFDPTRDLAHVRRLHEAHSAERSGVVLRDDALWEASLRNAGNPGEEFLLARAHDEAVAYLRATNLGGSLCITEWAHVPGFEDSLAALFAHVQRARTQDRLAPDGRGSAPYREIAYAGDLRLEPELAWALGRVGIALEQVPDPTVMLRCLDAPALAARLGLARPPDDGSPDPLRRALPPEEFGFWMADRF